MRRSRLLVIAAGVCTLAACVPIQAVTSGGERTDDYGTPVGDQRVRSGGELVMGLSNEPDRLDPTTSTSLYTRYVMNTICEKLYDLDSSGKVVPQLATALPTTSADGRTVTIPVRAGIKFADGSPFDANAVRTSLQRHLTQKTSQRASEMGPVESITASGGDQVVIRYKRPFAPITAALADRAGMIMSPVALTARGDTFGDAPVCVGPFKFVKRIPQTSITVTRDPDYYDAAKVHLDTIVYRIMPDANTRAANLRSDDVQVADTISPQDVDALAKDRSLRLLQAGSLGYQGFTVNTGNVDGVGKPPKPIDTPLARDARVREALVLTVDRQTLVNTVFNNWYESACSPIPPQSPYASTASNACQKFDPARSRQLLAEAGVPVPLRVELKVSNTQDELRYAQALQASVAEGGFDLRIVPVEYSTLLDVQKRGDFELLQLGWSGRIDPDSNTTRFLATKAASNVGGYSTGEMDTLLAQASQINDVEQRAELYGKAVGVILRDNPIVYTYRRRNLTVHTRQVTGVEVYADGVVRLGRAAFVEGQEG
ncbi:ABC transporter substrate-binding protein [Kibdelosporangium phytohabitans]|uniref:ABC transporter substrate-binding protein n=1 Tax=Kibdelosporangium phytohabitans TaxID=860235 RepID=A0A0N9I504_9PSEU|nr:ABC transporter substrate-binding protein [Kibdelosporangium phytohabitans]ALG10720.1 ABC transporter substrate-binding protein [Kibdelosporangium phytohabitans]MBE1461859.1 peptide/nickel transport system substrate-binding protein [Kibdelosporangium phytohabitans]